MRVVTLMKLRAFRGEGIFFGKIHYDIRHLYFRNTPSLHRHQV